LGILFSIVIIFIALFIDRVVNMNKICLGTQIYAVIVF